MFRRRKDGNAEEGNVCPYCKFVNVDAVENCAQCYYSMNLAARDQPMATPSTSGSDLLNTLMGELELEEEEPPTCGTPCPGMIPPPGWPV